MKSIQIQPVYGDRFTIATKTYVCMRVGVDVGAVGYTLICRHATLFASPLQRRADRV